MKDYDIRSIFEQMELELIASMKRNLSHHQKWENDEGMNWTMWQLEQLKTLEEFKKNNQKKFIKKFTTINNEIAKFLESNYKTSGFAQERAILKELAKGNTFNPTVSKGLEGAFFSFNEDKMNALIKATTKDMSKAEHAMLRMVNDQYRRTIYKAQVMANSGAFTLQQSIDMATKDFLKAGINCIEYKDGRRVNIASYAEMNIRTATKRAKLISEGEARNAYGIHTVRISRYGQCSETCLPWQGKVYVDDVYSGGTKEEAERLNLPLLSVAIAGGLFHPNCKHNQTTYFYDLKKSLGKLREDGVENPPEEQEHRKIQKHIQQQERIATGSLDPLNIAQAEQKKAMLEEKEKKIIETDVPINISSTEHLGQFFNISENDMIISITEEQNDAIFAYTQQAYEINQELRYNFGGEIVAPRFLDELKLDVERIDKVIAKFENPDSFITYRAIEGNYYSDKDIGDIIQDKAFASSTPLYKAVEKYAQSYGKDAILKITVPKGKGYGVYINEISAHKDEEYEYLLKRDTKIKVTGIKQEKGYNIIEGVIVDE